MVSAEQVQGIMAISTLASVGTAIIAFLRTGGRAKVQDARRQGEENGLVLTTINEYAKKFDRAFETMAALDTKRQAHELECARDKAELGRSLRFVSESQERLNSRLDSVVRQIGSIAKDHADSRLKEQLGGPT